MIIGRYIYQIYEILIHHIDGGIFATMYKGQSFHHESQWNADEQSITEFAIKDAKRRPWTIGDPITPRILPALPNHPESGCEYPNHKGTRRIDVHSHYIYTDLENNITERKVCRACYAQHILRYYPTSLIAKYVRANRGDYKNRYQVKSR